MRGQGAWSVDIFCWKEKKCWWFKALHFYAHNISSTVIRQLFFNKWLIVQKWNMAQKAVDLLHNIDILWKRLNYIMQMTWEIYYTIFTLSEYSECNTLKLSVLASMDHEMNIDEWNDDEYRLAFFTKHIILTQKPDGNTGKEITERKGFIMHAMCELCQVGFICWHVKKTVL